MKKKFNFLLLLGVILVSLTTACSKKDSKPKTNPEPSASSLINAKFNSSLALTVTSLKQLILMK